MSRLSNGIALGVAGTALALSLAGPGRSQTIPADAQPVCAVSAPAFAAMFQSGSVTLDGAVRPANSLADLNSECAFYRWSEQMFLWTTSPVKNPNGTTRITMFSPAFFTVSPAFQDGADPQGRPIMRRRFLPNDPNAPVNMMLRTGELSPNMLPNVVTKAGQIVEVEPADPAKPVPPVVRLQNGKAVTLSSVKRTRSGDLQFFSAGKQVQVRNADPSANATLVKLPEGSGSKWVKVIDPSEVIRAKQFIANGIPVLVDSSGNVVDVAAGQAGGNEVLLTQNKSLIYYITTVNDVFAYSRTRNGPAPIPDDSDVFMPTTQADADAIVAFAGQNGRTIANPEALAIETKSSWIEASAVPDPENYISVTATIPKFDVSTTPDGKSLWTPNGERTVKLVMVGLHVVGSTAGHGEMLWSTFERFGNAPNAEYSYNSTTGVKTVPQGMAGAWLFAPNPATMPSNVSTGRVNRAGAIEGIPTVGANSVLRMHPWGSLGTDADDNTNVISATASIRAMLPTGDLRRNYFQVGTTWTIKGQPPTGNGPDGNEVGTRLLSNATLETYKQRTNCFACHSTDSKTANTTISHIYNMLKPLF